MICYNIKNAKGEKIMSTENENAIYDLLDRIKITDENRSSIELIRNYLNERKFQEALFELKKLQARGNLEYIDYSEAKEKEKKVKEKIKEEEQGFPQELASTDLEKRYIGLLLNDLKLISVYYFVHDECEFLDEELLEIYKTIIFTDAEKYAPEVAKTDFTFAKNTKALTEYKYQIQMDYQESKYTMQKTYEELRKLFILRKSCKKNPARHIQERIAEIKDYELYDNMTPEEVVDKIVETRDWAAEQFTELGFVFPKPSGNFLFVSHPDHDARELFCAMKEAGIYVRYWNQERIKDYMRVTVGTREEMDKLFSALEDILK